MASVFKGMSKDDFLDGLVSESGLNGHELYDYLMKLIEEKPVKKEKNEKKGPFFPHGDYTFTGNLDELREFYKLNGGSDEMAKWFGSMVPGLAAIHVAAMKELETFSWVRPAKWISRNGSLIEGWCKYSCWWKPEDQKYGFDDGIRVNEEGKPI